MHEDILLVAINAKYIHSNLAVYSLKAYAEGMDNGDDSCISIAEYTINNQVEDIIDDIFVKKPKVAAFSCYIWNIEYVRKIITELNKLLPQCHIWLGGPEVSYNTDYYLDKYSFIKGIFVGEGERSFKNVVDAYRTKDSEFERMLETMAGIVTAERREVIAEETVELSTIPFPYKDLKKFENRIIYYESSRGCPYSCSYCLSCIDKKLRFRNIELVERELMFFIENKVPQVKFIDRTFNCDRERSLRIWKFISDNDNGITNFHFEISSDLITDEHIQVLKNMRQGLVQLEIGVQSTNVKTLDAIRRKMDIEKLKDVAARLTEKGNIHVHLDLIAGLPYEDIDSFKKSFNDVYNMNPHELQLGFLKVLHGAHMHEDAGEYGIVYKSFPPYEVLYTDWLGYEDILRLKAVEEVLEIYYGSGQFTYTVKYLLGFFKNPFQFYDELGRFYEKTHLKGEKHSRIERYNILLEFVRSLHANNVEFPIDDTVLRSLMTLDVYLRENIKSRPTFAPDTEPYRKDIKDMATKYNISKSEHIEVFNINILKYLQDELIMWDSDRNWVDRTEGESKIFVRFSYDKRNPITYNAKVEII